VRDRVWYSAPWARGILNSAEHNTFRSASKALPSPRGDTCGSSATRAESHLPLAIIRHPPGSSIVHGGTRCVVGHSRGFHILACIEQQLEHLVKLRRSQTARAGSALEPACLSPCFSKRWRRAHADRRAGARRGEGEAANAAGPRPRGTRAATLEDHRKITMTKAKLKLPKLEQRGRAAARGSAVRQKL
jgi:hypothetical protein